MRFDRRGNSVPLNNAGLSLVSMEAKGAMDDFMGDATGYGMAKIEYWTEQYIEAHRVFERLTGCEENCFAFTANVATAISQAAFSLPMPEGSTVLSWQGEYPSNAYPWIRAAEKNKARFKAIPLKEGHLFDSDELIEAIDEETSIVAISWVQSLTGQVADLEKISAACRKHKALLVLDVIQGLGMLPFDMKASGADVICGGTFKWLCSPLALGYIAARKELIPKMEPLIYGAMTYTDYEELATDPNRAPHPDFRRFETGAASMGLAHASAASAAAILDEGVQAINQKARAWSQGLIEEINRKGLKLLSPADGETQSPIVTFVPEGDTDAFSDRLTQAEVVHAKKLGGIRLSPHVYNTEEDLERVKKLLT